MNLLFYSLILEKRYVDPIKGRVSNMGSVTLAGNREQIWEQILACILANPWGETDSTGVVGCFRYFSEIPQSGTVCIPTADRGNETPGYFEANESDFEFWVRVSSNMERSLHFLSEKTTLYTELVSRAL